MNILIDDKYMTVSLDEKVISLTWKQETVDFTDESFKVEALKFEKVLRFQKPITVLVDMRDFRYQLSDEIIAWRKINIISTYNELNIKKFAFISEKPAVNQDGPENTFVTKTFTSKKEAIDWLTS